CPRSRTIIRSAVARYCCCWYILCFFPLRILRWPQHTSPRSAKRRRTMEWEGRQESSNVEDRRMLGGKAGLAIGGGAGLLILIVGLILGVDPSKLAQITGGGQGGNEQGQRATDPEEERQAKFTKVI